MSKIEKSEVKPPDPFEILGELLRKIIEQQEEIIEKLGNFSPYHSSRYDDEE